MKFSQGGKKMQVNFSLTLSQTQKLVMTPELRQAITILQLSTFELGQYIENQLLENPLLDLNDDFIKSETPVEREADDREDSIDWEEYFQEEAGSGPIRGPREQREEVMYENFISSTPSLQEHLMMQLRFAFISKTELKIGEFLIGNLDKNGYI